MTDGMSSATKIDTISLDSVENQQQLKQITQIVEDLFAQRRTLKPVEKNQGEANPSMQKESPADDRIINDIFKLAKTPQEVSDMDRNHPPVNPVDNMVGNLLGFYKPEQALKLLNAYTKVVPTETTG
jgi:hypothetical protein